MTVDEQTPADPSPTPAPRPREDDGRPFVPGQPIEDDDLRRRILARLAAAANAVDGPARTAAEEVRDFDSADDEIGLAVETVGEALRALSAHAEDRRLPVLVEALGGLFHVQRDVHAARLRHRSRALVRVQEALAAMHEARSVPELIELVPAQICRCGFDRAFLSRVHASIWVPESVYVEGDPAWAAEILEAGRAHRQRLDEMILETELVRRRKPIMVHDVQRDPRTHRPIAEASRSRSYVAAPIMPEGRVIGFLHADCYMSYRDVDAFDVEVLEMLADGVGYVLERTARLERLSALRGQVKDLTRQIATMLDEVADAEIEVARIETLEGSRTRGWASAFIDGPESRLEQLLTRREVEIMRLLARGATNRAIADRLVISDATVRTHVRHILKKLEATNRTEAVSRFMALLREEEEGEGPS